MYFDTHAHYDDPRFNQDRKKVLSSMEAEGISLILNVGSSVATSHTAEKLAAQYDFIYAAAGVHPGECGEAPPRAISSIRRILGKPKVVAVGEIGLDYYWKSNPPREVQQEFFRKQLTLAMDHDLPVIIHDREAHGDTLAIVKEYPGLRGVFHCYSGSAEMARELLDMGWYLGFDGPITYKKNRRAPEVLELTPMDRILLETDAPYLPPVPHRGERNDSRHLPLIARAVAEVKSLTVEEVARITMENGKRLFRIP